MQKGTPFAAGKGIGTFIASAPVNLAFDLKRCVDYTHLNPVKHKLVERLRDWPWSSFHRYVKLGEYEIDWGGSSEWFGDEFRWAE